jgi:RNA polymerase sigma-70 factor (ECF subfamily)
MEVALPGEKADAAALARADSFAAFVEARRERAVRVALRMLAGDAAAAEDVAQNALLRAYGALDRFRGEASLDTWFYRILVREVHRHRRWQALRRLWSADAEEVELVPEAPRASADPGLRRRISNALARLSGGQRDAFVLVHLEGCSVAEAAEALGKAQGTIKSHLHRALETLRRELADLKETR